MRLVWYLPFTTANERLTEQERERVHIPGHDVWNKKEIKKKLFLSASSQQSIGKNL